MMGHFDFALIFSSGTVSKCVDVKCFVICI